MCCKRIRTYIRSKKLELPCRDANLRSKRETKKENRINRVGYDQHPKLTITIHNNNIYFEKKMRGT